MGFIKRLTSLWAKEKDPEPIKPAEKASLPSSGQSKNSTATVSKNGQAASNVGRPAQSRPEPAAKNTKTSASSPQLKEQPSVITPVAAPIVPVAPKPAAPKTEIKPAQSVAVLVEKETVVAKSSAPPIQTSTAQAEKEFFAGFGDDDFDDLDAAFDAVLKKDDSLPASNGAAGTTASEAMIEHDQTAVAGLFADIAASYARPVKNFIFELKRGTATKEWIEICRPAMRSISKAAESMGLTAASDRMNDFDEALSLGQDSDSRVLSGDVRELILTCYFELIEIMPQAFTLGQEEQLREGIIINSLLKQIPDLGRVTFEKMYSAGLTSLDTLFLARKEELTLVTGIPMRLAEAICGKLQEYKTELEGASRDVSPTGRRNRLAQLVHEMRDQHAMFVNASEAKVPTPASEAEKRSSRQLRESSVLKINIVLAEMGEIELVEETQKLSYERRIQRLEEYLAGPAA
jgi:hypothetical protein